MRGLTSDQVAKRRDQGLGNDVKLLTSRTTEDILKTNLLNPVSLLMLPIAIGLLLVGDYNTALLTVGLIVFNTGIGIIQEVRAKIQLDKIALLAQARVAVIRDGSEQQINPSEVVQGDVLVIRAGDQLPIDGAIVGEGRIEVDESALTGEADLVSKLAGDTVLSGSFCVIGETLVEATQVGLKSFANELTENAREFRMKLTPLQQDVNLVLRILLLIVLFYSFLAALSSLVQSLPVERWLQVMTVITGAVSGALLTMITLNYSWGALKISRQGGLVQQINAVESLCNTTVLCTDKTGTLTANKIAFHDVYPIGVDRQLLGGALGDFAASAMTTNKTTEALITALPGAKLSISDEVIFSSALKWSALIFDDPDRQGLYVLGAMEMLQPKLTIEADAIAKFQEWTGAGLRVLAFARNLEAKSLHPAGDEPLLPSLELIGLVSFGDELRPHLRETLAALADNDIQLKIMSGDNPYTVAALAKQAGFPENLRAVSGLELANMGPAELAQTAQTAEIFGRVTPEQKEALVEALRDQGEYVAMIGDGINDVLSLKKADIGIAMESGSTATRSVSDMILLNDSFEAMPPALTEGQRITNAIQDILRLYFVKVFAVLLIIIAIEVPELGFPFTPSQSMLLSIFATGLPPFILAITATPIRQNTTLHRNILHFTLPAAFGIFLFGLLLYTFAFVAIQQDFVNVAITPEEIMAALENYSGIDVGALTEEEMTSLVARLHAQTALTAFFVLAGIILMLFAQPPLEWFVGGAPYSGNRKTLVAALVLIVGFLILMTIPALRAFFQMVWLPIGFIALTLATTVAWMLVQRAAWRSSLFERFLGVRATSKA